MSKWIVEFPDGCKPGDCTWCKHKKFIKCTWLDTIANAKPAVEVEKASLLGRCSDSSTHEKWFEYDGKPITLYAVEDKQNENSKV